MSTTTSGRQAITPQNVKEIDSVKESISDIINQLQDIDPARLSFSPFLDLDTQISLAPVSDSPESSVEELHSSSHSVTGSQRSLEPLPAADHHRSSDSCHQRISGRLSEELGAHQAEQGVLDRTVSTPVATTQTLEDDTENRTSSPSPASLGDMPNGTDAPKWSPQSSRLDSTTVDECRPLMGAPPDSMELTVWPPGETRDVAPTAPDRAQGCCRCRCCHTGRLPALLSVLASLLSAFGIFYALYFHVPINPPHCPDVVSRIIFVLCCCVVAAVPILLAMLTGAVCQFCTGSLSPVEPFSRRRAVQQLFVAASLEQLFLYVLNLLVMASLLPQDQLKLIPILVAIFVVGRLVYWGSLHMCSSWRGIGSGLTVFPLLAMLSLNLYLMYHYGRREPLFGAHDMLFNQAKPTSLSMEMSQGLSGQSHKVLPTDILDTL